MKKQILIVDDENDCAELLRYHLQKENYDAVIAHNGKEAIEAVQRHTPDAVLLDIMMPELNGWEVCRILRESTQGRSLPIIMLTALTDEDERIKGLSLGADDYLSKPYSMKELLLKLRKHLDRQQAIKQLQSREQERDTAVRYMVHELQNSLTAIGGFSSRALRKDGSNKYMKTINMAASHAESLLNDASLLSRLENGKERLFIEPVAIGLLVEEAVDFLQDTAKKKKIEVITVNSTAAFVHGNRTAIRQIMVNIISNAVKYNREKGTVLISFDHRNDRMNISIQDEGNGIANAELDHIFDKFYRAAGSERVKGAGLGLYIVKLLANAMGGEVKVASKPGSGSTFTVSFIQVGAAALHSAENVA
jgi:two-component system, sensor histidine kinase and response regulator